ncbi:MAG: hypothetical protein ACI9U2_000486 [Bradymonadia bacterium]|jgi:hypothetical protein
MMAIAYGSNEFSPQALHCLTHPVSIQLNGYLRGTRLPLDRFRLLAIKRWMCLLASKSVDEWPDLHRVGGHASRALGQMIDTLDRRIHEIDDTIAMGVLNWSMIRRHMLLQSRRAQLAQLSVDLADMVHTLLGLY